MFFFFFRVNSIACLSVHAARRATLQHDSSFGQPVSQSGSGLLHEFAEEKKSPTDATHGSSDGNGMEELAAAGSATVANRTARPEQGEAHVPGTRRPVRRVLHAVMVSDAALSPSSLQEASSAPPFGSDPTWQQAGVIWQSDVRGSFRSARRCRRGLLSRSDESMASSISRGYWETLVLGLDAGTCTVFHELPGFCQEGPRVVGNVTWGMTSPVALQMANSCIAVVSLHSHSSSQPTRGHRVPLEPSVIG